MTKYLIIYHKEDNDGVFSMAIFYNYLVHEVHINESDIKLLGADYTITNNLNIEDICNNYENVIMTDISSNEPNKMLELYKHYCTRFIWIDHHAPIIAQSVKCGFDAAPGWRDSSRSAILNAYRYLYDTLDEKYQNHTEPMLLRILSAWDSFSYEREGYSLDYVRHINVGTTVHFKLDPKTIIEFVLINILYPVANSSEYWLNKLYELGKQINDAKDEEYEHIISDYGDMSWTVNGRTACALFMQVPSNSLMFKSVANNVSNGIVFKHNPNTTWTISLYNTKTEYDKEFHCGSYLKMKYKGGGHAGAAGCQVTEKEFIKILKSRQI